MVRILDGQGNTVVKYAYDPWGVPTIEGDEDLAAINPCSYRGYYYDEETGYYYLRSRYYDPEIGRFINADDIGALGIGGTVVGLNLVLYCENCPIAEDDQSGYGPIWAFGIQFTITIGKLTLGLEALWKQSSRQFYLFGFIGGTRTIDLAFLKSKEAGLIPKILSLLRSLTKLSLSSFSLFKGLGISVSFIVVLGNRYASFPRSYCGWFTGFSASFYHVAISGAYAVSGKMGIGSVGIGVTSSAASIGLSQTYYFQLTGNDALANNLAEAKTSIYNKVAWLRLFGFWH
ncbi:MAG: RHS repeat-associated core domain-containing protein [Oscillospiraceae bacterium]|nr:RHS repeat-associated core domain-containing protein [Oscillospiraceae bacterium]